MNVTRAVLPVMRSSAQGTSRSPHPGLAAGFEFVTAYAASKFGQEGWMESLQAEVAPFGITTTIANPGFFRTELFTEQWTNFAKPSVASTTSAEGRWSSTGNPKPDSNPGSRVRRLGDRRNQSSSCGHRPVRPARHKCLRELDVGDQLMMVS
jgi:NAD(P)-dependent dehydrogenase (short-subunit alcohol dehydrogenase family)